MSVEKLDIKHVRQAQKSFTTHLNQVLQNVHDAFALGVYCYLSSLPHDWVVNKQHLMKHFKVGRDKIESIMAWLNVHCLIEYQQERTSDGKMGKSLIIVKDGYDFINNFVINQQHLTAPLKIRYTANPLSGKSAPTYINIKDTKEIKKTNASINDMSATSRRGLDEGKERKGKEVKGVEIPTWLSRDLWEDFKQHRKEIKKPMTALSEKRLINQLMKFKALGENVEEIINTSISCGWSGVFPSRKMAMKPKNDEIRSTVKFFEPGNPDFDRLHGRH